MQTLPSTLSANPRFAALHADLLSAKLNPDLSTRLPPKRDATRRALHSQLEKARIQAARDELLLRALGDLDALLSEAGHADADGADDLLDAATTFTAHVRGHTQPSDLALVRADAAHLCAHAPVVAALLSRHFVSAASLLGAMLPDVDVDVTGTTTLAERARAVRDAEEEAHARLCAARAGVVRAAGGELARVRRQVAGEGIRALERAVHGAGGRAERARAEHAEVVARMVELKLRLLREEVPEKGGGALEVAMERYAERLRRRKAEAEGTVEALEGKVRAYEKTKGLKELVERCAELRKEKEVLEGEIARLEGNG